MALAVSVLTSDPSSSNTNSFASTSVTPTGGAGVLVYVANSKGSDPPDAISTPIDTPTWLDGSGWTEEATATTAVGSNYRRVTLLSGKVVSSPGADTLTITFANNQTGCHIVILEVTGQHATDYVLQPKTSAPGTTANNISITLDNALAGTDSICLGLFTKSNDTTYSQAGSETELLDAGYISPVTRSCVQYEVNDTTTGVTWTTASTRIGIACELRAATSGTTETPTPGGGTAGGTSPSPRTTASAQGALGQGTTPSPSTLLTAQGAPGQGFDATATATPTPGGGIAAGPEALPATGLTAAGGTAFGTSPNPSAAVPVGGVQAPGTGPAPVVPLTISGAPAGGNAPTEGGAITETPTPGGAVAQGVSPSPQTSVPTGGAAAPGTGPVVYVVLQAFGAVASGLAPSVTIAPPVVDPREAIWRKYVRPRV